MLVYGASGKDPRLLVLAFALSDIPGIDVTNAFQMLSRQSGIPCLYLGFDGLAADVDSVRVTPRLDRKAESVSLDDVRSIFSGHGLPVSNTSCMKYQNDKLSSCYHKWQRQALGKIRVSDIDLLEIGPRRNISRIIELKRSFLAVDEWRPFRDDFANFDLLATVAKQASADFEILYNRRTKTPFRDDPSRLAQFRYQAREATRAGIMTFDDRFLM